MHYNSSLKIYHYVSKLYELYALYHLRVIIMKLAYFKSYHIY